MGRDKERLDTEIQMVGGGIVMAQEVACESAATGAILTMFPPVPSVTVNTAPAANVVDVGGAYAPESVLRTRSGQGTASGVVPGVPRRVARVRAVHGAAGEQTTSRRD